MQFYLALWLFVTDVQVNLHREQRSVGVQTDFACCTNCGGSSSGLPLGGTCMLSPVKMSTPKSARTCGDVGEQDSTVSTILQDPHDETYCPSGGESFAE